MAMEHAPRWLSQWPGDRQGLMAAVYRHQARKGFTLIEVLIVIVVVAVLAAIVVPRLLGAGREAKEAALRAQLQHLRKAIGLFESHYGGQPHALSDLMADKVPGHCHAASDGSKIDIDSDTEWLGPYLTTPDGQLPVDPITGQADWTYSKNTGEVRSRASGTALDGTPYSEF